MVLKPSDNNIEGEAIHYEEWGTIIRWWNCSSINTLKDIYGVEGVPPQYGGGVVIGSGGAHRWR